MAIAQSPSLMCCCLWVQINSDDPAYFGGYICDNYRFVAALSGLGPRQLADLAAASFRASFLPEEAKSAHLAEVEAVLRAWQAEQAERAEQVL